MLKVADVGREQKENVYQAMFAAIRNRFGDAFDHELWHHHVNGQSCVVEEGSDDIPIGWIVKVYLDLDTDEEIAFYEPFLHAMTFSTMILGFSFDCEIRLRKTHIVSV